MGVVEIEYNEISNLTSLWDCSGRTRKGAGHIKVLTTFISECLWSQHQVNTYSIAKWERVIGLIGEKSFRP